MKTTLSALVLSAMFLGGAAMVGCDREISKEEKVTKKSDGSTKVEEKKTVEKPDGSIETTKEKKTVDK